MIVIGLLVVLSIIVTSVILASLNDTNNSYTISKSITRATNGYNEEQALSVAENLDYPTIFGIDRFTGNGFGWNGDLNDYSDYVWAQVVDAKVLNYYDNRLNSLTGNATISFNYSALVHLWNPIQVRIVDSSEDTNVNNQLIISSNGTILFQNSILTMQCAYYNNSWQHLLNINEINFNLSKSYVIEMELQYMEYYAPVAGYISHIMQTVIMDEQFQPYLILNKSSNPIS
jgi:hypothetical protein